MGFMPGAPDFLETPAMDRMAKEGAHLENAFVSTSLCSPSRASILTGHFYHGVWDDNAFYDLETDPHERYNLIDVPACRQQIEVMQGQLFDELEASGGLVLPLRRPAGERLDQRKLRR